MSFRFYGATILMLTGFCSVLAQYPNADRRPRGRNQAGRRKFLMENRRPTEEFPSGRSADGLRYRARQRGKEDTENRKSLPKNRILSEEYKLSTERIDQIKKIIDGYYDEHKDLESSEVVEAIGSEIARIVPLTPERKADSRSLLEIKKSLDGAVAAKYGKTPEMLRTEAESLAAKKYPMAKQGEKVTVHFKRGNTYYTLTGNYYGFGMGGRTVRINSRLIPLFDLTPSSKAAFDQNVNAGLRKKFIESWIQDYGRQRSKYSELLFAAEYAKIRKENEQTGYIYMNNRWVSASAVMNDYLKEMIKKAHVREEKERREQEERVKEQRRRGGEPGLEDRGEEPGKNEMNGNEETPEL